MANAPNAPHDLAHLAPHAIKHMANGIWYENCAGSTTTQKFIKRSTCPILRLPVELQVHVADQLCRYSDLKAFLLTCKELFDVATPCLYKCVDLRSSRYNRFGGMMSDKDADEQLLQKIKSLLIKPANLRFTRVLKASRAGLVSTELMDRLLPLIPENFLTEFNYSISFGKQFPTPSQLKVLWGRQKNLRNLKIYSHIVPALEEFFNKTELNQTALLKSFVQLTISDNTQSYEFNMISWPLKNLDLYLIQDLKFHGWDISKNSNIISSLNPLFAAGSFVSLVKLSFRQICFDETLELTNMPSLEHFSIYYCMAPPFYDLPLAHAHNIRLRSLLFGVHGDLDEICPLLTQIEGLEELVIVCPVRLKMSFDRQTAIIGAILTQKETIRILNLKIYPEPEATVADYIWEGNVMRLQDCKNLVKLWIPLTPTRTTSYYRDFIAALPRLSCLTISTAFNTFDEWSPKVTDEIFPASSKLSSILCTSSAYVSHRIIRRGL